MHTSQNSLLAKLSGGLSMAVLALAFSFGGSHAVRAEEPEVLAPALQEIVIAPIMKAVEVFEQRLTRLEATIGAFADSYMARRVVVQELCIADESGAQTCVTKGQLDAFLRSVAHADIGQISVAVTEATVTEATVMEAIAPPSAEPIGIAAPIDDVPAPAASVAVPADKLQGDPELEQTGSVPAEASGAALVWVPEVETTIAAEAPGCN